MTFCRGNSRLCMITCFPWLNLFEKDDSPSAAYLTHSGTADIFDVSNVSRRSSYRVFPLRWVVQGSVHTWLRLLWCSCGGWHAFTSRGLLSSSCGALSTGVWAISSKVCPHFQQHRLDKPTACARRLPLVVTGCHWSCDTWYRFVCTRFRVCLVLTHVKQFKVPVVMKVHVRSLVVFGCNMPWSSFDRFHEQGYSASVCTVERRRRDNLPMT